MGGVTTRAPPSTIFHSLACGCLSRSVSSGPVSTKRNRFFSTMWADPATEFGHDREVKRGSELEHWWAVSEVGVPARSGPAIRAVLAELSPAELPEFEAEFRCALAEADEDFDLDRVLAVIDRWRARAYMRLHPPTAEERALVARVEAGDFRGLWVQTDDGGWEQL